MNIMGQIMGEYAIPIVGAIAVLLAMLMGLLFMGIDRKVAARFQSRIGPPIIQPWRDIVKLMQKQTVIPDNAVKWLFNFAPVFGLTSASLLVLYVPFLGLPPTLSGHGDLVVVLYLFIMPALALVMGGFSTGNNYAAVGGQRKMIMMMSYELPLAALVVAIAWKLGKLYPGMEVFSFSTFVQYPIFSIVGPIGLIGALLLLFAILTTLCAELVREPFDAPEADTELAGGIFVDYSGRNLALFHLADAVKLCAFITVIIGLFFPYHISALFDAAVSSGWVVQVLDVAFFLVKFAIIMIVSFTFFRVAYSRLKITQAAKFFWLGSGMISLVGMLLIVIDTFI